jgi:glycosyltransferase involved in cell wall biosynthesis
LVIDDGSTDGSVDVIKTYRKRGVELIVKHNEGVVATKNLGIRQSETSWTVFLDADDIMEPDYLKVLYNKANKTRADVVYTDMRYFGVRDGTMQAGRFNLKRLLHGNFIHNSALISTSLLKQVGGYKTEMNGGYEDWELYITLAEHGANFDYVAKPLLHYRQHDLGSSRNAGAEVRAKQLWEMVHTLHAGTYRKYNGLLYKLQRGFQEVFKHPVLPVLAITLIPVGFAYGLKCFAAGFRDKILHYLRTYAEGSSGTKQQEQAEESPDQPQQP